MQNHHLHESVSRRKESSHDNFEELLALLLLVVRRKLNVELLKKSWDLILLEVHNSGENSEDRVKNELVESTLQLLALVGSLVGPLLGMGVEVVVTLKSINKRKASNFQARLTQRRSIILFLSTPNFLAYLCANCLIVKAQP